MTKRVMGQVKVTINGKIYPSKPGSQLTIGGIMRKTVPADNHETYYTEETKPWEIDTELLITEDFDESLFGAAAGDVTASFEGDTGHKWVGSNGWFESPPQISNGGGKVKIVFSYNSMRAA